MHKIAALAVVLFATMGLSFVLAPGAQAQRVAAIECASHQYRYQECRIPFRSPFLLLTKSASACVANQSWGYNWHTGTVWVARGCQGVFGDAGDYHNGRDYYRGVYEQYERRGYSWERGNYSDPPPRTYVDPEYHFNTTDNDYGGDRPSSNTSGYDDTGPNHGGHPDTDNNNGGYDDTGPNHVGHPDTENNNGGYDDTGPNNGGHPDTEQPGAYGTDNGPSSARPDANGPGNNGSGNDDNGDNGGGHPQ